MQSRIIKHRSTDTELTVLCHQYIVIGTSFTAFPKRFIIRQFIERNGNIAQFSIHFHYSCTAGQTENLSLRPS